MLVYRMEHRIGNRGPWDFCCSPTLSKEEHIALVQFSDEHSNNAVKYFPTPQEDYGAIVKNFRSGKHCLGCDSLDMIFYWFEEVLDLLKTANFIVRVFDVPDNEVVMGKYQIAFYRENANVVEEIEL